MKLPRCIARLRTRRGFGVHSPFAFEFITHVLNPGNGYAYYAEDAVRDLKRSDRRLALIALRVRCALQAPHVAAALTTGRLNALATVMPGLVTGIDSPTPGALVVAAEPLPAAAEAVRRGSPVLLTGHGRTLTEEVYRAMEHGMVFSMRHIDVIVPLKHLPKTRYYI